MKKDIQNREDLEKVLNLFFEKIKTDETLNHFFFEVVKVDWEQHMAHMCDFWENVLFYSGDYQGNPIETHRRISEIQKTEIHHFQKWKELFFSSLDSLYKGENVKKMKNHSDKIAQVMIQKI